jgi:hypothetical protein
LVLQKETDMTEKIPANEALRHKPGVIDQRQQQIDPAGKLREDPNDAGPKRAQKQAGQDLRNPQDGGPKGPGQKEGDQDGQ